MNKTTIAGITFEPYTKKESLEQIKKYIDAPVGFFHIVSLNPEIIVAAQHDDEFKAILNNAAMVLADGVGLKLAGVILGISVGERVTGVQMMEELIGLAGQTGLNAVLIGGKLNLAEDLAACYQKKYPEANFFGLSGISDIKNPTKEEEDAISRIVTDRRPHIVIVAFGSPWQEKWIERHSSLFQGTVCIGVGGAFDFLSGSVARAPNWVRIIGFEWLFRLIIQPWRWKRQIQLLKFMVLVMKERLLHRSSR